MRQVFELLSALEVPGFTRANWQSTIRGELVVHAQYADTQNWSGRETADIVYTDRNGLLTQYLQENCDGGFAEQMPLDYDYAALPIEYYLEVKSTSYACNRQFFMSSLQYGRVCELCALCG